MLFLYHIGEFRWRPEAGALPRAGAGHLVVTTDEGLGELAMEVAEEADEGASLRDGAGVLGFAVSVETALIADADGAAV